MKSGDNDNDSDRDDGEGMYAADRDDIPEFMRDAMQRQAAAQTDDDGDEGW